MATSKATPTPTPNASFTVEQFQELLQTQASTRSMARCTVRYNGSLDKQTVENFATTVEIYIQAERVSDMNALAGFPLLLEGTAMTWWKGVSATITNWQDALKRLKEHFSPRMANHKIYLEVFWYPQINGEKTEAFIGRKRALLAEATHTFSEGVQLDLVFGKLAKHIKEKVSRESVTTFVELIKKAREIEDLMTESNAGTGKPMAIRWQPVRTSSLWYLN